MDNENSIIVRVHWLTRVLFSVGLLVMAFTFFSLLMRPTIQLGEELFIELFVDFGLFKLASSYIEANEEYILVNVFYGTYKIKWVDVRNIKTNGSMIAFIGDDNRVVISLSFAGRRKNELIDLIRKQANKCKIEIKRPEPGEIMPITHLNSRE